MGSCKRTKPQRLGFRVSLVARLVRFVSALMLVALMVSAAWSQDKTADLTERSIEDLMNIEVTSVSKKEQKLSEAAAAVFVITSEDIRRSGATNIPDLLRMVPGIDVGEINGSTWAVSARGFNQQFSTKLLVMIDNRVVYTLNFGGVYWDQLDYPLADIDRIEVTRGPGGTIWGANAVNGVISIFTKKAKETRGALVEGGFGNVAQGFALARYGGKFGAATDYMVYSRYDDQFHFPGLDGQNGGDGWHQVRTGFRTDSAFSPNDSVTVEGSVFTGREGELGFFLPAVTSPSLIAIPEQIDISEGFVQASWNHKYSEASDSTFQASYGRSTRDDPLEPEIRDTAAFEYRWHLAIGSRHDVVLGLGDTFSSDHIGGSLTVFFVPAHKVLNVFDGFVQDEIEIVKGRLYVTVGTKFERNTYTQGEVIPGVRATWVLGKHSTAWASIQRGLRTPSRNDTNLRVNLGSTIAPDGTITLTRFAADTDFQDERLVAYEAGYRAAVNGRLTFDLAAYYNRYNNLTTEEPTGSFFEQTPPPPHQVDTLAFENFMRGETHGIEMSANWKATNRWTLSPGYALELLHMHTDPFSQDPVTPVFVEHAAPRHSAQLRSHVELGRNLSWDAAAYFVDRLSHEGPTNDQVIPAYTCVDTGLTWRPGEHVSIGAVGQNLVKDHHLEFEDNFGSMQSGQVKRSGYLKVSWRF